MKQFRLVIIMVAVAVFTVAMAGSAFAQPAVSTNGEVEVLQYAVTLDDGYVQDYGALDVSQVGSDIWGTNVVIRNTGTDTSDWLITGTDASNGSSSWEIDRFTADADTYMWLWKNITEESSLYIDDDVSGTLADNVSPGDSRTMSTFFRMPTSSTGAGTYTMQATIWAVAP
ncbi:MAG: hypothetical protein C0418_01175 [Coriobacteriaceae bacterium]|nr:hypothetical protein [Coriobacteriaceae bacterium]